MEEVSVIKEQYDELNRKLDRLLAGNDINACGDRIMTNAEMSKILGVSLRTLQNYRDKGLISFSQVGRKIFYSQEDLTLFINKFKV